MIWQVYLLLNHKRKKIGENHRNCRLIYLRLEIKVQPNQEWLMIHFIHSFDNFKRKDLLNFILKNVTLLNDNDLKIKTPLREDLRPMLGLIHQAYVLCGLTTFYKNLLDKEPYKQMLNVQKRYNIHLNDYGEAVNTIQNNDINLSNEGVKLLNELINDVKKHG